MKTWAEVTAKVTSKLNIALKNTTEILLNELKKTIDTWVYSYPDAWTNGWGGELGRTGDFGESWDYKMTSVLSSSIQQYYGLDFNPPFSHGSWYSKGKGALKDGALAEIIEKGLSNEFHGFPNMQPRPFWQQFINYVSANLDKIFATECQKVGLDVSTVRLVKR